MEGELSEAFISTQNRSEVNTSSMEEHIPNPVEPSASLKRPLEGQQQLNEAHHTPILPEDSAVTKAEKVEGNGLIEGSIHSEGPAAKRAKLVGPEVKIGSDGRAKVHGVALVKQE